MLYLVCYALNSAVWINCDRSLQIICVVPGNEHKVSLYDHRPVKECLN